MGAVCSNTESNENRRISKTLQKDSTAKSQKLLLLGAGLAGKSTIFKQVSILYSSGYDEKARENYTPAVSANVLESIKTLVHEAQKREQEFSVQGMEYASSVMKIGLDDPLTPAVGKMISFLWKSEKALAIAFEERSTFGLGDSAAYMLDSVERICTPGYIPSEDDIVRVRVRTSSIVEMNFKINNVNFQIVDVGGQRGERRKWIHCFDNVTAVIFVAAISEYDQVLEEDPNKNRVEEAIGLFDHICNSKYFLGTAMILFLNKIDLFQEKLKKISLRTCFPDYEGGSEYSEACEFVQHQFVSLNLQEERQIYVHFTCATDTANIRFVFNAVKDIILAQSLKQSGFS
eukprot:c19463_g1_i4.p1 GENE.c19463_g1_i4~~c19463_g1_i4.p1  ORF type:complete len:346 (+),score=89.01 c19463_g1_i4:6-1043(+)